MQGIGKDLTKEAPRSPHEIIGGFAIIARTIDKCRALLWGNTGEYHFDCPLDNQLFSFKGITGDAFKAYVETGASDEEVAAWVKTQGVPKTDEEIAAWSQQAAANNYANETPEKKKWLSESAVSVGLSPDATLFDFLDADDRASFVK